MSSGWHFQKPCCRHSEFRISLRAKAPSQAPLKCVVLFFSLRLCLEVILTIREVIVWCSALPLYIACDSPQLLWVFTGTLWLARYLPSRMPQLMMSLHAFLLPGCGESSVVHYWPCKTNFLAVDQLMCIYLPWLWPRATALYESRISFSWLCISCCQDMLPSILL